MSIRVLGLVIFSGFLMACGGGGSSGGGASNTSGGSNNNPGVTTETEPNDDTGSAMVIGVPDTVRGSVNLALDEFDYFTFTLNQPGTVAIDLRGDTATMDLDLALYDQSVALIGISASDTHNEHIEASLDAGVTYYIEVEAFDTLGQTSNYTLDVSVSAASQPGMETEPNDTFAAPDVFSFPGTVTGSVNNPSDLADIFSFVPAQTGTYVIDLVGQGGGAEDIDLLVYEFSGGMVTPIAGSHSPGQIETLSVNLVSGIQYFMFVNALDTGSVDLAYSLSVQLFGGGVVTNEVEPNDSFGTAYPIAIPVDLTGSLNDTTDDTDVFILTPVQAGNYLIEMQGFAGNAFDLDLAIFDQNQVLLGISDGLDQFESITITLAAGLPYFVIVDAFDTSGQTFTYDLTIDVAP